MSGAPVKQPRRPAPIAILCFDRPDYFTRVLDSLLAQQNGRLDEREIVLFQDGARNAVSGAERARQADIDACIEIFRNALPGRHVAVAPTNIGVALNFDRAETYMFERRQADAAIFLEDDMVLHPLYLNAMERLIDIARHDERIGYVAAYGNHWMPLSAQQAAPGGYTVMEHNWAFGLLRRQWLRNKPYVDQYIALVRNVDYRDRPTEAIHRLFHSWGMGCGADSQDATKGLACCATGGVRLNTSIVLGQYIGERGVHMHAQEFARQNYKQTELYAGDLPEFAQLTDEAFQRIFGAQSRWSVEAKCKFA